MIAQCFALSAALLPLALTLEGLLIVLLIAGVAYCLYTVADLRRRLDDLSQRVARAPAPPPAPAVPPVLSASAPAAAVAPAPAPVAPVTAPRGAVPPEILTVIAASVHRVLGSRYRVVSAAPAVQTAQPSWSVEGRREIFSSHHLR